MNAHAKFSPSSFERWEKCPGSIRLSIGIPDKRSRAAEEGTRAHKCLELFLKNGFSSRERTSVFLLRAYDTEMVKHARQSAVSIWNKGASPDLVESEKKVYLRHIDPNLWGTLDATIVEHFGTLEIIDYKYGKHLPVEAIENGQLLTYAVGEAHLHHYNFDKIKLTIIQPRAKHEAGPIRSWEAPIEYLFEFSERLKVAVKAAKDPKAETKAGDHCFFCPAKEICPSYSPDVTAKLRAGFSRVYESPAELKAKFTKLFQS